MINVQALTIIQRQSIFSCHPDKSNGDKKCGHSGIGQFKLIVMGKVNRLFCLIDNPTY